MLELRVDMDVHRNRRTRPTSADAHVEDSPVAHERNTPNSAEKTEPFHLTPANSLEFVDTLVALATGRVALAELKDPRFSVDSDGVPRVLVD